MAAVVSDGGKRLWSVLHGGATSPATGDVRRAETSVAFTMAVIALSAKMAKADGVVLGIEKEAFYKAFRVADGRSRPTSIACFALAQQDTAGFELYAEQIARSLDHDQRCSSTCSTACSTSQRLIAPCIRAKTPSCARSHAASA